jgi:Ca2+-binding RTX toxin-like protein
MTTTTGAAVAMGTGAAKLNMTNLANHIDSTFSGTSKTPTLQFTLDSVPTGYGTATVKATITDGSDATRSGTEDQISVTVNVIYNGDGTDATITVPAGTATGTYNKGDGTDVTFQIANGDVDAFSMTKANAVTGMPASFDVKMGALYEAFVSGAGNENVLQAGTYNIALETTLPLKNYANETVTSFNGNVELVTSTPNNTTLGTAGNDTIVGTASAKDTYTTGTGSDTITIKAGEGSSSVSSADVVTDFGVSDKIQLDGGLAFSDLTIVQGTGTGISYNGVATTDVLIYTPAVAAVEAVAASGSTAAVAAVAAADAEYLLIAADTTAANWVEAYFIADVV